VEKGTDEVDARTAMDPSGSGLADATRALIAGPDRDPEQPDRAARDHAAGGSIAYDALPDGVVIADADGRVVVFNRAAARITRIRAATALGEPLEVALPLVDLEGRRWWSCTDPYGGLAIRRGQPEARLLLPDGRDVLVTATYVREKAAGGPGRDSGHGSLVSQVIVGLRDTSARARVDRRHADLIATVAHELRSPLTSVKGFTATLLAKWERFTDDQRKLMLETVDADADRVTRLIAELLDIARIDSGRLQLARYSIDLVELLRDQVAGMIASGLPAERFAFDIEAAARVDADPDKLRQVVANLLENAVRHGEGCVTITVGTVDRPPEQEGTSRMVAVTVDDEGPGIPQEMLGRVFTRFWRGNRRGGTGLGLYIVKGIVEAHGGTITVGPAPGGGARFRFMLPAA